MITEFRDEVRKGISMTFITANKKLVADDVLDLYLKELDVEVSACVLPEFDGFALSLGKLYIDNGLEF